MSELKTYFTKIFGEEIGTMLQVVIGVFMLMGVFMGGPLLVMKILTPENKEAKYSKIVNNSRENIRNIFDDLVKYDSLTNVIENSIDEELNFEKKLINNKREILIQLQNDFDSVYLTPYQLRILATVIPEKQNISFRNWITSANQLYNIGVSIFISFFFFYMGRRNAKIISETTKA